MHHITHIAFLGPKGSFSHIASQKYASINHFKNIKEYNCQNFDDIVRLIQKQKTIYGILPIENSISGLINEVYDLLQNTNLSLIDEIKIPIKHCLLTKSNIPLQQIQTIYSHPQAFQQCDHFLKKFPNWKMICCKSSSDAMQIVSQLKEPGSAALGNKNSGTILYGLQVLKKHLTNTRHNITRFLVLGHHKL